LVTVSIGLFLTLMMLVSEGGPLDVDEAIFMAFRNAENPNVIGGPSWMKQIGQDITALGGNTVLILLSLLVITYLYIMEKRELIWVVLTATGGAIVLSLLLKSGFDRPRPDLVSHATRVYTSSFPSAHAMVSASVYLTMGVLLARTHQRQAVKAFFIAASVVLTLIIGVSRVYLGVHWPTDILAGWAAGLIWAVGCCYLARRLDPHNQHWL
jgi:undecaprenyl-diphosphatase